MIQKEVTIINQAGMHTRPASMIVKIAAKYKSDFFISKNNFEVNGKKHNRSYDTCRRTGLQTSSDFQR